MTAGEAFFDREVTLGYAEELSQKADESIVGLAADRRGGHSQPENAIVDSNNRVLMGVGLNVNTDSGGPGWHGID